MSGEPIRLLCHGSLGAAAGRAGGRRQTQLSATRACGMADGETSALLRVVPAESEAAPTAAPGPDATQWWRCWRYRVALTAALGEAIVYGQRISVPIALVVMQAELGWDKEVQGIVMTGFWV